MRFSQNGLMPHDYAVPPHGSAGSPPVSAKHDAPSKPEAPA